MTNKVFPGVLDSISRGYTIASSALFDRWTDAPNPGRLTKTFVSPTAQHTWTFSTWFKRGTNWTANGTGSTGAGAAFDIFEAGPANNQFWLYDNLSLYGNGYFFTTTPVFRDPSAWYHVVLAVGTAATGTDKVKVYVNGVQITTFDTDNRSSWPTAPSAALSSQFNGNDVHSIGGGASTPNYYDGYLAETYFVDGQQLTPSSFGETSSVTGTWVPKKYGGTYGNNGYYLNYSNASSLGADTSGRGNTHTKTGTVYASKDVPYPNTTNTLIGNYAVWNTSTSYYGDTFKGNTRITCTTGSSLPTTMFVNSGKWYWEVKWVAGAYMRVGVCNLAGIGQDLGGSANAWARINSPSRIYNNGSTTNFGTDPSVGDTIMVAMDVDAGKIWYGKNGSWEGSGDPTAGTTPAQTFTASSYMSPAVASGSGTITYEANFGSLGFTHTAPTGFKALNTSNLPEPSIKKAPAYFKATAYTGNGTSKVISGLNFSPNLVMLRSRAGGSTGVHDTVRSSGGSIPVIYTDQSAAQSAGGSYLTSFNSDGYTINSNTSGNANATNFMGWAWKEDAIAGMDIVTYTGNGSSSQAIAHNLSAVPKFVIIKPTSFVDAWFVWHTGMAAGTSGRFGTPIPSSEFGSAFGGVLPTSSNFYAGGSGSNYTSASGQTYVAYLWTDIPGYSKFGTYTGNGSPNGPFVYLGFKPAWFLIKNITTNEQWAVMDSERPTPGNNLTGNFIPLQSSGSEDTNASYHQIDKLGNGFKIRAAAQELVNSNGNTYIYAAFAESPFKYSLGK